MDSAINHSRDASIFVCVEPLSIANKINWISSFWSNHCQEPVWYPNRADVNKFGSDNGKQQHGKKRGAIKSYRALEYRTTPVHSPLQVVIVCVMLRPTRIIPLDEILLLSLLFSISILSIYIRHYTIKLIRAYLMDNIMRISSQYFFMFIDSSPPIESTHDRRKTTTTGNT